MENMVMVLTSKGLETIFEEGGSGHWAASAERIERCRYVVLVRHGHSGWSEDDKPHNSAFLIGRGLSTRPGEEGRLIIGFREYAPLNLAGAWPGNRNPVAYGNVENLALDLGILEWRPFPFERIIEESRVKPLSIREAKLGIAKALGISQDAIEITIRA